MRLAISNIAWDIAEDESIVKLLQSFTVDAIDVAPGKYFPDPAAATDAEILRVKRWWSDHGIEITGMQALLFGTTGFNVFGHAETQSEMLMHLAAVCRIGAGLGATRLVFGSPKNRDRSGLSDNDAMAMATAFFGKLGDIAAANGVLICLEPNPIRYGANFMTSSEETAYVVRQVAHPSVRMQFDTGALASNGEDPEAILQNCAPLIGHVHISEPDLLPLGEGGTDHAAAAHALRRHLPNHAVSIEMVATRDEPHGDSVGRALDVAIRHYRDCANEGDA